MGNNQTTFDVEVEKRKEDTVRGSFTVHSTKQLIQEILLKVLLSPKHFHLEYLDEEGNWMDLLPTIPLRRLPKVLRVRIELYSMSPEDLEEKIRKAKIQRKRRDPVGPKNTRILTSKQGVPSKLGEGSFGVVYLGKYCNELVAIKTVKADRSDFEKIEKEIEIIMDNDHPNVLKSYGYFSSMNDLDEEEFHIVMELCSGGDLWNNLHKPGGMLRNASYRELLDVMIQISYGVRYLHKKGVIHRDLKSNNILLNWNTWKLCDFGSSKVSKSLRGKTIVGTPEYVAPEVLCVRKGEMKDYSELVDMYSLGIVFWEIWTRKRVLKKYFDQYGGIIRSQPLKFVEYIHGRNIRPSLQPEYMGDNCPEELIDLIKSLWSKNPEERPEDLDVVVNSLKHIRIGLIKKEHRVLKRLYFGLDQKFLYFKGEIFHGIRHGYGKEYYDPRRFKKKKEKKRLKLEGEFWNGSIKVGKLYGRRSGTVRYEGEFREGMKWGFGRTFAKDGRTILYEGNFWRSYYHGFGKLYRKIEEREKVEEEKEKEEVEGEEEEEEEEEEAKKKQKEKERKVGRVKLYEGNFEYGDFSGKGIFYDEKGRMKYKGEFRRKVRGKGGNEKIKYEFRGIRFFYGKDWSLVGKECETEFKRFMDVDLE